jgi:hypothetical protein
MAQATLMSRRLQLQFEVGTTASGLPKIKVHNFANVSAQALDDDLLAVGQALAALFPDALHEVARTDQTGITA